LFFLIPLSSQRNSRENRPDFLPGPLDGAKSQRYPDFPIRLFALLYRVRYFDVSQFYWQPDLGGLIVVTGIARGDVFCRRRKTAGTWRLARL